MRIEEIGSKNQLLTYVEKHNIVKKRLIKPLIEKCQKVLGSSSATANFIISHHFFRNYDRVLIEIESDEHIELRNSIVNLALKNQDIPLLCALHSRFELSNEIIESFFKEDLNIDALLLCIEECPIYSKVYEISIQKIKSTKLSDEEFLFTVNSLNQLLYGRNSIIMSLYFEELNADLTFNTGWPVKTKQSTQLEELREYILRKGFKNISDPFLLHFLIDLVLENDQKKLNSFYNLNPSLKKWVLYELKLKSELSISVHLFHQYDAIEMINLGSFEEIWEYYQNSNTLGKLNIWFNVVKLYVFRTHHHNLKDDINYETLLSNKLTAYYFKILHDLNIVKPPPLMSGLFDWPSSDFDDVKRYLKHFDADFKDQSPLGYIGYTVASHSKLSKNDRQSKLQEAFLERDFEELDESDWGEKGSPIRLKSMANHIAIQIRWKRSAPQDNSEAIRKWKEDLKYLKSEFYDGKFSDAFIWPSK